MSVLAFPSVFLLAKHFNPPPPPPLVFSVFLAFVSNGGRKWNLIESHMDLCLFTFTQLFFFFFCQSVFLSLSLVSGFYTKMSLSSPLRQGLKIHCTPAMLHPACPHVLWHVGILMTYAALNPADPSSSWRKTSTSAVSCQWCLKCRKIKLPPLRLWSTCQPSGICPFSPEVAQTFQCYPVSTPFQQPTFHI